MHLVVNTVASDNIQNVTFICMLIHVCVCPTRVVSHLCDVGPLVGLPGSLAVDVDAHVRTAEEEAEANTQQPDVLVHPEPHLVLLVDLPGEVLGELGGAR